MSCATATLRCFALTFREMKRIELIDLWRTVAIVCMVAYHFLFDLALFGAMTWEQFFSPALNAFQMFICCSFILVSGVSARFSRNNLKRGAIVLACAVIVGAVSYFMGQTIRFGILHFLGCAMIIYGLFGKHIEKLPERLMPVLCLLLFFAAYFWVPSVTVKVQFLYPFGFRYSGFSSADYFPLLPWLFLFLLGTWLGGVVKNHSQAKLLNVKVPAALTFPGRHSLIIYMLHQPVLYGITWILMSF